MNGSGASIQKDKRNLTILFGCNLLIHFFSDMKLDSIISDLLLHSFLIICSICHEFMCQTSQITRQIINGGCELVSNHTKLLTKLERGKFCTYLAHKDLSKSPHPLPTNTCPRTDTSKIRVQIKSLEMNCYKRRLTVTFGVITWRQSTRSGFFVQSHKLMMDREL